MNLFKNNHNYSSKYRSSLSTIFCQRSASFRIWSKYHSFGFESKNVTFSKADPTRGQVSQIEFEIKNHVIAYRMLISKIYDTHGLRCLVTEIKIRKLSIVKHTVTMGIRL